LARKILLADDSVTAQNMGRKILSDAGYDVVTVNNGSAALKRVAEMKPDLIVLDVYMPGYSGLEVCQRLKDSPDTERIPVLLTVGKLEPFKPEEARRVRADGHIIKPFEASELLSALARMEDRMVPGKSEGSRTGGSKKSEGAGDADSSWTNRLRFPSKKKKEEEPEPEADADLVGGPSFRNFRRGKSKASSASTGKAARTPLEPTVVPDIPRDITPEELDALSALAARLDSPAATETAPAVVARESVVSAENAPPAEAKAEFEVAVPVGEEPAAVEIPVAHLEPQGQGGVPSAKEPVPEASAVVVSAEPVVASEPKQTETVHVETLALMEPTPVDREDEPMFATAAVAAEPVPHEEKVEVKEVAPAVTQAADPAEKADLRSNADQQNRDEPKVEDLPNVDEAPKTEQALTDGVAPTAEETAEPKQTGEVVPAVAAAAEAEVGPAPSEEELAEALRLLTPALGQADLSSMPTREILVAAGAVLAEQVARNSSEAPRWVAASVAASQEEAALSLEAEMFRTLAGPAVVESDSAAKVTPDAVSPAVVSSGPEAKAEISAEIATETIVAPPTASSKEGTINIETAQTEQAGVPTTAPEQTEEPAVATLANAVMGGEIEVFSGEPSAEFVVGAAAPVEEVTAPAPETTEVATAEVTAEGEEDMAKERSKTGKSNWHQIRTGPAAAGTQDIVEAAKQAEPIEEAPKAMAAAAAAESAPSTPDSNAIASIVDSVLADLRPKIVEEIAKKLAGK